jgi:excisionase family DNA binding protein
MASRRASAALDSSVERLWERKDVAAYLHLSEGVLVDLIKTQGLPMLKIGSRYRARKSDIDNWLNKQMATPEDFAAQE